MNVVSVWRPGFPVLRLFVVYIAPAPSNYCADATPTRGVWRQTQSLRRDLSRLCRLPDRSTPTRREGETSHLSLYITENFINFLLLTCRGCPGPSARSGHFQSDTLRFFYWRIFRTPVELAKNKTNKKNTPKKAPCEEIPGDIWCGGVKDKYVFIIICIGFYWCIIIENHPVGRWKLDKSMKLLSNEHTGDPWSALNDAQSVSWRLFPDVWPKNMDTRQLRIKRSWRWRVQKSSDRIAA